MKKISIIYLIAGTVIALLSSCDSFDGRSKDAATTGKGGSMARFTISGDFLYTVDHKRLKVFDVSQPEDVLYLSGRDQMIGSDIETIFAYDTLLLIGSQNGMFIYSIKQPGLPQQTASVWHFRSCDPVVASGNYAYVTLNSENIACGGNRNLLQVYDISNPKRPKLLRELNLDYPKGLGVDKNKLFVCSRGIRVYDISDPVNPVWIDDLSYIPEVRELAMYDVIPLDGILLAVGQGGFFQFDYTKEKLSFISKIAVNP